MRHTATLLAALMFAFIARAAETAPVPAPVVKPALPLIVIQPRERAIFQRDAHGVGEVPVAVMISAISGHSTVEWETRIFVRGASNCALPMFATLAVSAAWSRAQISS